MYIACDMETNYSISAATPFRGVPKGAEFAHFLVERAGLDSVRIKGQIEGACIQDLSTYFEDKRIRFSLEWLKSLVKAELAGGSFAAANMPERLQRHLADLTGEDIAGIAADISVLLSEKRSDFNYLRYSLNAVSTVMGDLFRDNLFDIPGLTRKEKNELEEGLKNILEKKLNDTRILKSWLDDVTSLHYKVIELLDSSKQSEKQKNQLANELENKFVKEVRINKQHVSTKSLSTYKLRVDDYAFIQSQAFLEESSRLARKTEFEIRLKPYEQYAALSNQDIKLRLKESGKVSQLKEKYLIGLTSTSVKNSDQIVSITENISSKKKLIIRYSGDGVSQRLIKPILNSLRSQLLLNPNQREWRSEARSGNEYLSVTIDALKSDDLSKIEKILQLHTK